MSDWTKEQPTEEGWWMWKLGRYTPEDCCIPYYADDCGDGQLHFFKHNFLTDAPKGGYWRKIEI